LRLMCWPTLATQYYSNQRSQCAHTVHKVLHSSSQVRCRCPVPSGASSAVRLYVVTGVLMTLCRSLRLHCLRRLNAPYVTFHFTQF